MKARVKWIEGMSFLTESGSGHAVVVDGAPEAGGRNLGPRPMEMVLMGTGACTSFDVMLILKKSRADVRDCVVDITSERAESDPKVFTKIHMHFTVTGHQLKAEVVKRAIDLSAEKYCSASIMLGATAEISHDFTVVEVGAA
jgi:putative redox protein